MISLSELWMHDKYIPRIEHYYEYENFPNNILALHIVYKTKDIV